MTSHTEGGGEEAVHQTGRLITCPDIYGTEYTFPVEDLEWRPSAYGVILKGDCVLVTIQHNVPNLPGGGVEKGESPEDAVIRETKEETGIIVVEPRIITVHNSYFAMKRGRRPVQAIGIFYACTYAGGELSMHNMTSGEREFGGMPVWLPLRQMDDSPTVGTFDWKPIVRQVAGAHR